jgi:hypothetical protein
MIVQNDDAYMNFNRIKSLIAPEEIARNICGFCLHSNNYTLSLRLCKYFANHQDAAVRASVIHGLGYIGMNFKKIDKNFAKLLLDKASKENDPDIVGAAVDARDDLQHYVKDF